MKTKLLILSFLLLPFMVSAHGGVSKNAANTIVFLSQQPLSPLVGEKVKFTFALTTSDYQPIRGHEVDLNLKQTNTTDPALDSVLATKKLKTDQNGDFRFEYTFASENYFDIELVYKDPTTQEKVETGFLVQVRPEDIQTQARRTVWAIMIAAGICLVAAGLNSRINKRI